MRFFLIPILFVTAASVAQAHAFLDHAEPRVGSTGPAPSRLELFMTEELEPAFTHAQVFDAQSREVDRKDTAVRGASMTVSLPKLGPGTYLVKWQAVATDTHKTFGTFSFTVR